MLEYNYCCFQVAALHSVLFAILQKLLFEGGDSDAGLSVYFQQLYWGISALRFGTYRLFWPAENFVQNF